MRLAAITTVFFSCVTFSAMAYDTNDMKTLLEKGTCIDCDLRQSKMHSLTIENANLTESRMRDSVLKHISLKISYFYNDKVSLL